MDLEFEGAPARGLRRYVTLVAEGLGLTGPAWIIQLEPPTSVYLALDRRLPEFPARDAALLWDEHHGWSMAVEPHGTEDLLAVAYLGGDLLPAPRVVVEFANTLVGGGLTAGSAEPPLLRARDTADDLPARLGAYATPPRARELGERGEAGEYGEYGEQPLAQPEDGTLAVRMHHQAGTLVLRVAGEIDMITEPALLKSVGQALDHHPGMLVVDLSQVTFFGSAGLHVLAQAQHEGGARHTRIRVVAAAPGTLRPLRVTGMDTELEVYPTLRQALITVPNGHTPPARPPRPVG